MPKDDDVSPALEALKASILESTGIPPSESKVVLIPDPANQQVVCKIELRQFLARRTILDKYGGIAIGGTVYFCVHEPPKES